MEIEKGRTEPPPDKRGNIARTCFYMDWVYSGHGIISKKNRKLFQAWDKEDPVDERECERCKRIEGIQDFRGYISGMPCDWSTGEETID